MTLPKTLPAGLIITAAFFWLAGCGFAADSGPPRVIPSAFWGHAADPISPRQPGSRPCTIYAGGQPPGIHFPGVCTTVLYPPRPGDLRLLSPAQRKAAWGTVVLTETWHGYLFNGYDYASSISVISREGKVLTLRTEGSPPQAAM